ncbi:MAG: thioesterase family protein [Alphaproteobacteria bacterium]
MKPLPIGAIARVEYPTDAGHSAAAMGNTGVAVVSSIALIGFIEMACASHLEHLLDAGEATVGVGFHFTHLAPAPLGARVTVRAKLSAVAGRSIDFEVEAHDNARLLMTGRHRRAVIDLAAFMTRNGARDQDL